MNIMNSLNQEHLKQVLFTSEIQFEQPELSKDVIDTIEQKKNLWNYKKSKISYCKVITLMTFFLIIFMVGSFLLWGSSQIYEQTSYSNMIIPITETEYQSFQKSQILIQNFSKLKSQRLLIKARHQESALRNLENKQNRQIFPSSVERYHNSEIPFNDTGIKKQQVLNAFDFLTLRGTLYESQISMKEKKYYEQKYCISAYQEELPICVVVPSFNNIANDRYKANIGSILQQNYKNFHIVFIDDASTDQTFNKTLELINQKRFPMNKVTMIRNDIQKFAMHNLRRAAIEFCKPQELFIIVDGDDQLIGRQVFKLYSALFQNTGAYFVYTNFMTTEGIVGFSRPIPERIKQRNKYRDYPFVISHLRAFYTKLFQLVREQDLQDNNGNYFKAANDVAICQPILQMSGTKVQYFPQITYLYNSQTGLNNHQIRTDQQKTNDQIVRERKKYGHIQNLFDFRQFQ